MKRSKIILALMSAFIVLSLAVVQPFAVTIIDGKEYYSKDEVSSILKVGFLAESEYNFLVQVYNNDFTSMEYLPSYSIPDSDLVNGGTARFALDYAGNGVYFKSWYNYLDNVITGSYHIFSVTLTVNFNNGGIDPSFLRLYTNRAGHDETSASNNDLIQISQIFWKTNTGNDIHSSLIWDDLYKAYRLSIPVPNTVDENTNNPMYDYKITGVSFKFQYAALPINQDQAWKLNTAFYEWFKVNPFTIMTDSDAIIYQSGYNDGFSAGYIEAEEFQKSRIDGLLSDKDLYWRSELDKMQVAYNSQANQMLDEYNALKDSFDHAKELSYDEGKKAGFIEGKDEGLIEGFNKGVSTKKDESLRLLIFSVFDAIGSFIFHFIGFDFLGVNLLSLMTAIFTLVIFFFLLGWLMKILGKLG